MDRNAELLNSMHCIAKFWQSLTEPLCRKFGITQLEKDLLGFLSHHPQSNTARDIVELRMLPKANVSIAVESLMCKGYLIRQQDTADRRRIHLLLTAQADSLLAELAEKQQEFIQKLFDGFSDDERMQYQSMNARIFENAHRNLEGK